MKIENGETRDFMCKRLKRVAGYNYVIVEGCIYLGSSVNNAVFRINCDDSVEILAYSRGDEYDKESCWAKCSQIGDTLLFSPYWGNGFLLYDIKYGKAEVLDINIKDGEDSNYQKFWETATYGRYFFVMGLQFPGIIKINADTYEYCYLTDCISGLKNELKKGCNNSYFLDGHIQHGRYLYIPTGANSILLQFDCESEKSHLIKIPMRIRNPLSISLNKSEIWITDRDETTGNMAVWNMETHNCKEFSFPTAGIWFAPTFFRDYAYFFPMNAEAKLYRVNIKNLKAEVFEELDVLFRDTDQDDTIRISSTMMVKGEKECVTFIRRPDCTWFTYNFKTGKLTRKVYRIGDKAYLNALKKDYYDHRYLEARKSRDIIWEENIPIKEFIRRV